MELDRHVARALDLENAWWHIAVVRELGVGIVIHQQDIQFLAASNYFLEVLCGSDRRGRVVWVVEIQDLRLLQHLARDLVQVDQKSVFRPQRIFVGRGFRQKSPAQIGVVARLRHDRIIALCHIGEGKVRDPLLRPNERDDLLERMEILIESPLHESRDCFPKLDQPQSESVPAHGRNTHRLRDAFDHCGWRRKISVAGAEIDDVDAASDELALLLGDFCQRIFGKAQHSIGVGGHYRLS